jgi:hypothetical protein
MKDSRHTLKYSYIDRNLAIFPYNSGKSLTEREGDAKFIRRIAIRNKERERQKEENDALPSL